MNSEPRHDVALRFHQLLANDRNSRDIYRTLSQVVEDRDIAEQLATLAEEEEWHIQLDREVFDLLEKEQPA